MRDAILCRRAAAPHDSGMVCALLPADSQAEAALSKVPLGEVVAVKLMRDRSLPMHRLFFAILSHVGEATEWETAERLLVALKIRLGRYDLCKLPSGKAVPVPQSISFAAMDQDEFARFFHDAINVLCAEVLDGHNPDDLIAEVCQQTGLPRPKPATDSPMPGVTAESISQKHIVETPIDYSQQDRPGDPVVRQAELNAGVRRLTPHPAGATNAEPQPVSQPDAQDAGEQPAAAPRSLKIDVVKPIGKPADWFATAQAMIERIAAITPGDVPEFRWVNEQALGLLRGAHREQFNRVQTALRELAEGT